MGLLQRFTNYIRNLSLVDPKAWNSSLWQLLGNQTTSGINVTEETALNYSAVYNAISLLSGTIAALPLHTYKATEDGKRKAEQHPVYEILHSVPNTEMTAFTFREVMVYHLVAWGNFFAEKVFNGYGELVELWPIAPNRVRVFRDERTRDLRYEITLDKNQKVILSRERILHIPGLGFDGLTGYSVLRFARETIGLAMACEEFGNRYFGSGTHPGAIVSHPAKLSQQAHDNLKDSLTSAYSGLGKSHKLLLLEEGMKMENLGIPPNDSQFLETRKFAVTEIARWFNIPPHKIKDLERSTFSNVEQSAIEFVQDTILPWLVRIEQNLNMQLLTVKERRLGYFLGHVVEGLLRGDSVARASYYNTMFNIGAFSINDIRKLENMNTIEGGDEHFVPLNTVPLSMAKEIAKIKAQPPQPKQIPDKSNGTDKEEVIEAEEAKQLRYFWKGGANATSKT